jgi:type 1 fimbria pilin
MTIKAVGLILFSIVNLTFSVEILAEGGTLGFHGKVVNSSCDVRGSRETSVFKKTRIIQVAPGVPLVLDTESNACSGDVMAFSSSLHVLTGDNDSMLGVVTLTYQ